MRMSDTILFSTIFMPIVEKRIVSDILMCFCHQRPFPYSSPHATGSGAKGIGMPRLRANARLNSAEGDDVRMLSSRACCCCESMFARPQVEKKMRQSGGIDCKREHV